MAAAAAAAALLDGARSGAAGRCIVGEFGWLLYMILAASVAWEDAAAAEAELPMYEDDDAGIEPVRLGRPLDDRRVLSDMDVALACLCFCERIPSRI